MPKAGDIYSVGNYTVETLTADIAELELDYVFGYAYDNATTESVSWTAELVDAVRTNGKVFVPIITPGNTVPALNTVLKALGVIHCPSGLVIFDIEEYSLPNNSELQALCNTMKEFGYLPFMGYMFPWSIRSSYPGFNDYWAAIPGESAIPKGAVGVQYGSAVTKNGFTWDLSNFVALKGISDLGVDSVYQEIVYDAENKQEHLVYMVVETSTDDLGNVTRKGFLYHRWYDEVSKGAMSAPVAVPMAVGNTLNPDAGLSCKLLQDGKQLTVFGSWSDTATATGALFYLALPLKDGVTTEDWSFMNI